MQRRKQGKAMKKATHQQTKQHNRDLVLRTIFANESISRAEVARVTNLSRATVSELVNDLLDPHALSGPERPSQVTWL